MYICMYVCMYTQQIYSQKYWMFEIQSACDQKVFLTFSEDIKM